MPSPRSAVPRPAARRRAGLLATAALALPLALLAPSGAVAEEGAGAVGPVAGAATRAEAVTAYRDVQRAQRVRAGWTGSVKGCKVGRESAESRAATRTTINRLRGLAGVRPIRLDPELNRKALTASLLMRANGALDHDPPASWKCWSKAGKEAAGSSNLFLGVSGAAAMVGYADDNGQPTMGHRRWLLNPTVKTLGTGSTGSSNALQTFGAAREVPAGTTVAWPPAGFVPRPWAFADWTLEIVGSTVDVDAARVRVTVDGTDVPVSGVRALPEWYGPGLGLTWRPALPASIDDGDHRVVVTVSGVDVDGDTSSITWTTTTVDVG